MKNCRVCKNKLIEDSKLVYRNVPASAQGFLESLESKDKGIDLEIGQCSRCGLVQITNTPVEYYKDVIRASGYSEEMRNFRIKQFGDFIREKNLENKRLIEIGSGKGEFVSLIGSLGIEVHGLENSIESVNIAKKNNLRVHQGFVESPDYLIEESPYDGFFTFNFLEHLPNINQTIRGIANNLKDNGIGIVEVPNFDMILKKKLFAEFIRDHIFYFTKETLENTLEMNGFEVLDNRAIWHDYILSAKVRKNSNIIPKNREIQRLNLNDFREKENKIIKEIRDYANHKEKTVVWGASHQALFVLSLAKIGNKIKYIIDSAPFKQGKYTPATHIPIVSPEILNKEEIKSILIMAGSYSDEIAKKIKNHQNKIEISILRDYGLEKYEK